MLQRLNVGIYIAIRQLVTWCTVGVERSCLGIGFQILQRIQRSITVNVYLATDKIILPKAIICCNLMSDVQVSLCSQILLAPQV